MCLHFFLYTFMIIVNELRIVFRNAMNIWEESTCIDFIPIKPYHTDYIVLKKAEK